jgi:hypothetical protein
VCLLAGVCTGQLVNARRLKPIAAIVFIERGVIALLSSSSNFPVT